MVMLPAGAKINMYNIDHILFVDKFETILPCYFEYSLWCFHASLNFILFNDAILIAEFINQWMTYHENHCEKSVAWLRSELYTSP
jgi:hypothetical protein